MSKRTLGSQAVVVLVLLSAGCIHRPESTAPPAPAVEAGRPAAMRFRATAYSIEGRTASGGTAHEGIVAADPARLPLGSRIRVRDAGKYSGEYVVRDTGRKVAGNTIDIYLANDAEAKRFGRRTVTVEVLRYGNGGRVTASE